jgi:predicted nucleotidyltransferase
MIEYIYAFGSICRGEVDDFSDIDVLVIKEGTNETRLNPKYSYYRKKTLDNLWDKGNPFAWHLYKESRLLYSVNGDNYISELGKPSKYERLLPDLLFLRDIFAGSKISINEDANSMIFDLSTIFLVVRNIATCYELGANLKFCFTRDSAIEISENQLKIDDVAYNTIRLCRVLSTRGIGLQPTEIEIDIAIKSIPLIDLWIDSIINKAREYE